MKSTRAQSSLEFALILPVFLVLGLLIIQFGLIVKTQIVLTHSTREGARAVASHLSDGTNFDLSQAQEIAEQAVFESSDLDSQKTQVMLKKGRNNLLQVKVVHKISLLIPLTNNFFSNIEMTSSLNISIPEIP